MLFLHTPRPAAPHVDIKTETLTLVQDFSRVRLPCPQPVTVLPTCLVFQDLNTFEDTWSGLL